MCYGHSLPVKICHILRTIPQISYVRVLEVEQLTVLTVKKPIENGSYYFTLWNFIDIY